MATTNKMYKDIMFYLRKEYKKKGCNFYFSAKKIHIEYSNHQKGRILAKMYERGFLEKWNDKKSPAVWKTKF